jgi:hypothetical protein
MRTVTARCVCWVCGLPHGNWCVSTKGLPYFSCDGCRTKIFLNTQAGMDGIKRVAELASANIVEIVKSHYQRMGMKAGAGSVAVEANVPDMVMPGEPQ